MTRPAGHPSDLAAHSWTAFDRRRAGNRIAVIPTGAVEVYGPHLPLGSDSYVAESVARLVAERLGAWCAPLIPVGYSADLMMFPGTLSVAPSAFVAYLEGMCRSLVGWGLDRLVFLNTHLGNVALIEQVMDNLNRDGRVACLQIDWWRYSARHGRDLLVSGDWAAGHAGELGTSVLLYLAQDLVHWDAVEDFTPSGNPWPSGLLRFESYREITPSGVLGSPSTGTLEKGRAIVLRCVEAIAADAQAHFAGFDSGGRDRP